MDMDITLSDNRCTTSVGLGNVVAVLYALLGLRFVGHAQSFDWLTLTVAVLPRSAWAI